VHDRLLGLLKNILNSNIYSNRLEKHIRGAAVYFASGRTADGSGVALSGTASLLKVDLREDGRKFRAQLDHRRVGASERASASETEVCGLGH